MDPQPSVWFDIDDTLVDFQGAARLALTEVARQHLAQESVHPDEGWVAWTRINDHHYDRFLSGELAFGEMQRERMAAWVAEVLPGSTRPLDHQAMEDLRTRAIFGYYRLYDDVRPALARLRTAGIAVGVISNSDGDYQRRKLRTVNLPEFVETGVFSGDVGAAKPDPVIFHTALAAAGVPAERAWYVGDRWHADVLGAAAAGWGAIWLNRTGATAPTPAPTGRFAEISGLGQLDRVLTGRPAPEPER